MVADKTVKVALVETPPAPVVPAGYHWIGTNGHEIAVSAGWTVQKIPGGSSQGVSATNPQDPNQKVILFDAYCAGCSLPDPMAGAMFASFSSPRQLSGAPAPVIINATTGEIVDYLQGNASSFVSSVSPPLPSTLK